MRNHAKKNYYYYYAFYKDMDITSHHYQNQTLFNYSF